MPRSMIHNRTMIHTYGIYFSSLQRITWISKDRARELCLVKGKSEVSYIIFLVYLLDLIFVYTNCVVKNPLKSEQKTVAEFYYLNYIASKLTVNVKKS